MATVWALCQSPFSDPVHVTLSATSVSSLLLQVVLIEIWEVFAVYVQVTTLQFLIDSMDTGKPFWLAAWLRRSFAGLFPADGGAVAALVEQHISLIGLKLVLCEEGHTVRE